MKGLHTAAFILLVIGGLNWLFVGLFSWDIGSIFGGMEAAVSRVIYVLVGLAAITEVVMHKQHCKQCTSGSSQGMPMKTM